MRLLLLESALPRRLSYLFLPREQLRASDKVIPIEEEPIFQITGSRLFKDFQKLREEVGIVNFRWHDLRHEATSRLFEKGLNIMEVASITGHQDLKMLKRYTHLRAEDLVERLGQTMLTSAQLPLLRLRPQIRFIR